MNEILKSHNIKSTTTRERILKLFQIKNELVVKDIKDELSNIDLSTIYRTLDLFTKNNIIVKMVNDGELVYSLKDNHNHYLKCIKCHKKIIIESCPFDGDGYDYEGFQILNHTILIEGICSNCQKDTEC